MEDNTTNEIPDGIELTPFSEPFYQNPYTVFTKLHKLAPIHKNRQAIYDNTWTITDPGIVKSLLQDHRCSVDCRKINIARDPRADNAVTQRNADLMMLDEPDHGRLRGLVAQAFTPKAVAAFRPAFERIVDDFISRLEATRSQGRSIDLVTHFAKPVPTVGIAEFLGIDATQHRAFKRWTDSLLLQSYPMPTADQWTEIEQAHEALRAHLEEVINQRRDQPKTDLVSALITAEVQESRLSATEVIDMCYLLIGAGNFTTTDLISNSVLALLRHPDQLAELHARPELIDKAIQEVLRFDSPSLAVRRFVTEDLQINEHRIEAGSVVNLVLAVGNHLASGCPHPEQFQIGQAQKPHSAFGSGIHHCLGAPLAKMEAEVAVLKFFQAYPDASLVNVKRNRTMDFRGCRSLIVQLAQLS